MRIFDRHRDTSSTAFDRTRDAMARGSRRSRISADPASPLTTLLHRAAHVDVDDRGAALLARAWPPRAISLGRAADELHATPAPRPDPSAAFRSDWRVSRITAWLATISPSR